MPFSMRLSCSTLRSVTLVLFALSLPAWAVQYEAEIDIDTEDDLYELQQDGAISDETLETLIELLQTSVDLNTADRDTLYTLPNITYAQVDAILAYRTQAGRIADPTDLVAAGAIPASLLTQLVPFLELGTDMRGKNPVKGRVRAVGTYALGDTSIPGSLLQARLRLPLGFTAGVLGTVTRRHLGRLQYNPNDGRFTVSTAHPQVEIPKFFLNWKGQNTEAILGTFRIGFGQRLTLDNTTSLTPNGFKFDDTFYFLTELASSCNLTAESGSAGSPCGQDNTNSRESSDFRWTERFRGVAATHKIHFGSQSLSVTGFGSYQTRSLYQYELYDRSVCDDPRGTSIACKAPPIYAETDDAFTPGGRVIFSTLPALFNELAAGGNATFNIDTRTHIGVTGWGASSHFNVAGADLGFQEYSRFPDGGPYGALGIDGAMGVGNVNLFAEVTRSFDSILNSPGGGFGAIQRSVLDLGKQEFELSLRYYGRDFVNPYARAISETDELEGQRVRNEVGARLRYLNRAVSGWRFRGVADVWALPQNATLQGSAGTTNAYGFARADYDDFALAQPSAWVEYRNRNLSENMRGVCYSGTGRNPLTGEDELCPGEQLRLNARVRVVPLRNLFVMLQYTRVFQDATVYDTRFQQGQRVTGEVVYRPVPTLRLKGRVRYYDEDVADNLRLEHTVRSTAEALWAIRPDFRARARYDNFVDLRSPKSLYPRLPTEHLFRLELDVRF